MSAFSNILARLSGATSVRASATSKAVAYVYNVGSPVFPERDFRKGAKVGFENNVTVFACVMEIARAVASLDWEVKLTQPDGSYKDAPPNHPLTKLLKRPNEMQSGAGFFEMECAYYQLAGNSYIEGTGQGLIGQKATSPPKELHILRPDRMSVVPSSIGGIAHYEHRAGSSVQKFDPSRILHRKSFNPLSDWYGFAPLTAASRAITADNSAQDWNVSLLQNSGRPSGILVSKGSLSDEQFNRIQTEVAEKYQGPNNAGRVMVADGEDGLEWIEMSATPKELEWLEGRKLSRAEICQAFQVPPELIGDSGNKTYSNFQEARKSFWIETVLPYADRLRDDLNIWLAPLYGENVCIEYDRSEIDALQEDADKLWTRVGEAVKDGRLTVNEGRGLMGFDVVLDSEADTLRVPMLGGLGFPSVAPAPDDEDEDEGEETDPDEGLSFDEREIKSSDKPMLWKAVDGARRAWEKRIIIMANKQLGDDERAVIKAVKGWDLANAQRVADAAIEGRKDSWKKFFSDLYMKVGLDFARGTGKSIRSGEPFEHKLDDEAARLMRLYVEKVVAKKVTEITSTTATAIKRAIKDGVNEGEGIPQLAARISKSTAFSEMRSRMIARTEVVAASNYGSIAGMKTTGLALRKVWVTTLDDRTRGLGSGEFDHFAADEQRAGLDESFSVSGESLDFPADSSHGASAGNVINCRCAVTFERIVEGEDE